MLASTSLPLARAAVGGATWMRQPACRSKEWGVMPWHWYWSSALPRSLLASMPLAIAGATLEPKIRPHAAAVAAFIALYSCLGHKEACCCAIVACQPCHARRYRLACQLPLLWQSSLLRPRWQLQKHEAGAAHTTISCVASCDKISVSGCTAAKSQNAVHHAVRNPLPDVALQLRPLSVRRSASL